MATSTPNADSTDSYADRGTSTQAAEDTEGDHAIALAYFNEAWAADRQNREDMLDDGGFFIGGENQWEGKAISERKKAQRPALTLNKLPQFVKQVTGEVRKNPPAIKVDPAGGESTKAVAEIYTGLIRNIQVQSNAKSAYVTAIEGAATVGQGAWRVVTEYSNDDGFEQDIRIKRIPDHLSFIDDPFAKEADRRDRRYFFLMNEMPRKEYERQFPDAPVSDMAAELRKLPRGWATKDTVRVAEYWCRRKVKRKLLAFSDGRVMREDEFAAGLKSGAIVADPNVTIENERDVEAWEVYSRLMNASEWLTEEQPWAGKLIPFAVVIGEEFMIGGNVTRKGIVRDAKDPQRIVNYMRSTAVEASALQPKAPFVVTVDQIKGFETIWQNAGVNNYAYLPYNPDPRAAGAPQRVQPSLPQTGLDLQAQIASQDMKEVIGIYDPQLGQKSNETSGRAILARQQQGDTGTFNFIDNLSTGIMHTGNILVDLIPHIYDTKRMVRVLGEDGTGDMVEINSPVFEKGVAKILNDMTVGEYSVAVAAGPAFSTRRAEAVESMTEFVRAVPQAGALIGDQIAQNMDWPGAEKIGKRLRTLLPPEIRAMEGENIPPPTPDPEKAANALEAAASADLKTAQADKAKAETATLAVQLETMMGGMDQRIGLMIQQGFQQMMTQMFPGGAPGVAPGGQPQGGIDPSLRRDMADMADQARGHTEGKVNDMVANHLGPALSQFGQSQHAGFHALGQGLAELGQHVRAGMEQQAHATHALAQAHSAETELVRDPKTGRATGSRKKPPQQTMN